MSRTSNNAIKKELKRYKKLPNILSGIVNQKQKAKNYKYDVDAEIKDERIDKDKRGFRG